MNLFIKSVHYPFGNRSIDESVRTIRTLIYRKSIERLIFLLLYSHVSSLEVIQRNHPKGRMVNIMIKIIEQEISFDDTLKKKLEFICDFCNTTPKFINGSIRKIDKTNLSYIEPHRIIINDITFLAFNYSNEIFIENLLSLNEFKMLIRARKITH